MRHGEALPTFAHPERPLTRPGRSEVEATAGHLVERDVRIDEIRHSELLRARQTAEILGQVLGRRVPLVASAHLGPAADPGHMREDLDVDRRCCVVVGHTPMLDRLLVAMTESAPEATPPEFDTAMAVCLSRDEGPRWRLDWVFRPVAVSR